MKEDKLGPKARKSMFIGFKKGMKGYKICDPKDKNIILSRDVIFDMASIVKPTDSQQVKSEYHRRWRVMLLHHLQIAQCRKITPDVIHGDDHVANEEVDDAEDQ